MLRSMDKALKPIKVCIRAIMAKNVLEALMLLASPHSYGACLNLGLPHIFPELFFFFFINVSASFLGGVFIRIEMQGIEITSAGKPI